MGTISRPGFIIPVKPFRSIREMSVDVAAVDSTNPEHVFTFTDYTYFMSFQGTRQTNPGEYGSLIHGNVGSRFPGGEASMNPGSLSSPAYYNAGENITQPAAAGESRQCFQSPPDTPGQAIQNGLYGANILSASLAVYSQGAPSTDQFVFTLMRGVNGLDNAAYMGGGLDNAQEVCQWGPFFGTSGDQPFPNLTIQNFVLPISTHIFFKLQNITTGAVLNSVMGSIFLHG